MDFLWPTLAVWVFITVSQIINSIVISNSGSLYDAVDYLRISSLYMVVICVILGVLILGVYIGGQ